MTNPTTIVQHDVELPGCTPEPLMSYLKALGILRLVSEQVDSNARGWWNNDVFWIRSKLDRDGLTKFFLEEYSPTPIVVPWSGGDFFAVNWAATVPTHKETPTASSVIESFLTTTSSRLEPYRIALAACRVALENCGLETAHTQDKSALKARKAAFEKLKWEFIATLRANCEQPETLEWMDAAAVTGAEAFAPLLGSGGGSDGNTHFSDNFMQNLWDSLPDFDSQRHPSLGVVLTLGFSRLGLRDSMFREAGTYRTANRTSSLFDSGAVGGPNATQGMVRESLSNPWDVIIGLEGTLCFAAAAGKRLASQVRSAAVFPFQCSATPTSRDLLAEKERSGREIWLPLWQRPCRSGEIQNLLKEGRAEAGSRPVRDGVDMARAIVTLGIDRGVGSFYRYAILKGRVGGDNYNTAASLGRFAVTDRPDAELICEIDPWLHRFRRACAAKTAPARLDSVLRRIDSAIFDFCRHGGAAQFQRILIGLGGAEQALGIVERFRDDQKIKPIADLSQDWITAADDGSPEFRLALALASIQSAGEKVGPLRANLEAVDWSKKQCKAWAEKDRSVVWSGADLSSNLANVIQRRMMDATRAGCDALPIASNHSVSLEVVSAFLAGELDELRIEQLLWGLLLVKPRGGQTLKMVQVETAPLPREYALLKLLFLPTMPSIVVDGETVAAIRPEPRILPLLRAGRIDEACKIAANRLRVSGLSPIPSALPTGIMRDSVWESADASNAKRGQRLAAALLIPISHSSITQLIQLVTHVPATQGNTQ